MNELVREIVNAVHQTWHLTVCWYVGMHSSKAVNLSTVVVGSESISLQLQYQFLFSSHPAGQLMLNCEPQKWLHDWNSSHCVRWVESCCHIWPASTNDEMSPEQNSPFMYIGSCPAALLCDREVSSISVQHFVLCEQQCRPKTSSSAN